MAGTPADLTIYKDNEVGYNLRDHTYYGRGCNNDWGTDGLGGSATPCPDNNAGGRFVETADGETQKNGTYYHYQAATIGTGGAMGTDKTDTPDTFCPLGWQMPYSGTGGDYYDKSRSCNYLFTTYSIAFADGTATDATKIKSYPFSYVYSGNYHWYTGRLYRQSNFGLYWTSAIATGTTNAYDMYAWSSGTRPAHVNNKASGNAIRCVDYFSIPHRRHGGRNGLRTI